MTDQSLVTGTEKSTASARPNESVEYLNVENRSAEVTLKHPFRLSSVEYRKVTVRRLTGHEAKAHVQACMAAAESGAIEPPFPGIELPATAYAALDDDDILQIDRAIDDFFPERFRVLDDLARKLQASPSSEPAAE